MYHRNSITKDILFVLKMLANKLMMINNNQS